MINYQSQNPTKNFLMLEKTIDDNLSPEAYYLLVKLMKLSANENNSNQNMMKKTKFSKRKFDKAKKELVAKKYLDTKQVYDNVYAFYICKESVLHYRQKLKKSDNRHEKNEMKKSKEKYADGIKM